MILHAIQCRDRNRSPGWCSWTSGRLNMTIRQIGARRRDGATRQGPQADRAGGTEAAADHAAGQYEHGAVPAGDPCCWPRRGSPGRPPADHPPADPPGQHAPTSIAYRVVTCGVTEAGSALLVSGTYAGPTEISDRLASSHRFRRRKRNPPDARPPCPPVDRGNPWLPRSVPPGPDWPDVSPSASVNLPWPTWPQGASAWPPNSCTKPTPQWDPSPGRSDPRTPSPSAWPSSATTESPPPSTVPLLCV